MRVFMAEATTTVATTTTTTPDTTGAVDTMVGPTVAGAQELAGAGDGAEHPGMDTTDTISILTPFMQLQHSGSPTI